MLIRSVGGGKLKGNLDLSPLGLDHGRVVAEEARLASDNPLGLGLEDLVEAVNTLVKEFEGEISLDTDRKDSDLWAVNNENVIASIASGPKGGGTVKEAHGPVSASKELSGVVGVGKVELDWGSHGNVSALNVIEEYPEGTALAIDKVHEDICAFDLSATDGGVGLQLNSILRGGCIVGVGKRSLRGEFTYLPKISGLGGGVLVARDSDRLTSDWGTCGPCLSLCDSDDAGYSKDCEGRSHVQC